MTFLIAPPAPVGPGNTSVLRPSKTLPQSLIDEARKTQMVRFDAEKHLNFRPPSKILSMKDIGYEGAGISENAVSEPFPLFTPEAVAQMRAEVFSQPVLDYHQCASDFASHMIRGFGPTLAPFIFDAWYSPDVLEIVSRIAGIDLVPVFEYDVGHVNIALNDDTTGPGEACVKEEDMSAFAWHFDSIPFVCVTMLSDCSGMTGGETAIKTGTGDIIKVRGPTMGTAVVMQGRYLEHQALKAFGRERISMVTSFRPKSALVRDETVLTGVRAISQLPILYRQYSMYRLQILEERCRNEREILQQQQDSQSPEFDIASMRSFLIEQKSFLQAMLDEIV